MTEESKPPENRTCSLADIDGPCKPSKYRAKPPWSGWWCPKHKDRWRRHGDPLTVMLQERSGTPPPIVDGRVPLANTDLMALVDLEDAELVGRHWWFLSGGYAGTNLPGGGKIYMHQLILPGYPEVDHVDRAATLDNRRANLRPVTRTQQQGNVGRKSNSTQPYKGIQRERTGRWRARIKVSYRARHLGTFDTAEEAARAYDAAAIEAWGEYACTNVMLGLLPDLEAQS